jgi:hypothetical protein
MSVHGDQVEAPVQVDVQKRAAESEAGAGSLADAGNLRCILG